MEVAVGDYEVDLNRMINAASKKYYEDRDQHCLMIEQQVEKLNGEFKKNAAELVICIFACFAYL